MSTNVYHQYPDLQMYPTVASAVVPIYNLNAVNNLVLSLQILAKIWSGRITTWDHPDIQADNPNFTSWNIPVNQSITLVAPNQTTGGTMVFKKSMAGVDPVFLSQVGTSGAPTWNGVPQVVLRYSSNLCFSYVKRNLYALSFGPMADAMTYGMPMVKLNRSGVIVEASPSSVGYALLERGISFGNNGDAAAHLTADLYNAENPLAWPISSYAYLVVRKSTLRPGATCTTVSAMVNFWVWFWNSNDVASLASTLGFSVLPNVVSNYVVTRFKQDMQCGGSRVWQEEAVPVVAGFGPGSAVAIFKKFQEAYSVVNTSVELNYTSLQNDRVDVTPLLQAGGFVVSTSSLSAPNVVSLVLGAEAVVAISQFTLTLDGLTLAKILNGDIRTWLHADILALNPNGLRDSNGLALTNTTQSIVLMQDPTAGSAPVTALLQMYHPAYTGAAILAAEKFVSQELLWLSAMGTPYSFSISAFVGQLPVELLLASIVSGSGTAVAPSLTTASACAANASFNAATQSASLALNSGSCYPLLLPLYVHLQRQCPTTPTTTERAVTFLEWMFSETTLGATLDSLNLVSLNDVSTAIQVNNEEALFQLSCGVRPTPSTPTDITTLLLAIIIPVAAVVLIGIALCGWWMWHVTANNRALRKKFSNDNVAESCAEAIAHFDLDTVAWLREVKEPNKIQQSFLAIIAMLMEVKPYIPDQLLARLTAGKANACEEEADQEAESPSAELAESRQRSPHFQDSYRKGQPSMRSSQPPSPNSPVRGRRVHQSITSSEGARQLIAMRDWTRKRCTYMCVRFGSSYEHAERRLLGLSQVVGRIVDIAKANGATIDAVGVDFINVHWGVASTFGGTATKAVEAGLEMSQLRETLPEEQQAAFWLQMGIGKGFCDCGTVSSESGHRFFVVWGLEASLALEIAMTNLPKKVLTSLLVSPAVHQEVQFAMHCMPRLWHGNALLWEPMYMLGKENKDDEWMYELRKINEDASLSHKTLLETFLMSKDKATTAKSLSAHIAELKSLHGGDMSAQDVVSLDLLLAMAHERHHDQSLRLDDDPS
eukprot:GGOE01042228.1.p1 GENE.GGOE01042228.1~~GGOE01042228.1.p1  ORF type:complete len:1153 (-),score=360.81 GGOE01042228.1:585-3740(-)